MTNWIPNLQNHSGPRYLSIAQAIETAIRDGELLPGQKLPTHRELAYQLSISVQTVSRAYAEVERRRLVIGETGRGTFVQLPRSDKVGNYISDKGEGNSLDFSNIYPLLTDAHDQALKKALSETLRDSEPFKLFAFRPTSGTDVHREAGVRFLRRCGVETDLENIMITNSGAHGVWVAMASATAPGDIVATEALVDYTTITNASILKLQLRGLQLDDDGIIPESFEELCQKESVKLLCVTPTFSNPTASSMNEKRRQLIANIARKYDVVIIESDDFGPFTPTQHKPLWCYAPERTYYSTSVMVTGVMTGYLVGPPNKKSRLITRFRATGWMANSWAAEVVTKWLYDGTLDELIRIQQRALKARHRIFAKFMRGQVYTKDPYSPHVWLTLPDHWRSAPFVEEARERGILVTPPDPFIVGRAIDPHAVRLAFGHTIASDVDFERGVSTLANLLSSNPEFSSAQY